MLAELARQDQLANDLANASTPGYKPDRSAQRSFGDVLLASSRTGLPVGPLGFGAQIEETVTDWAPGPLRDTGEPLDLAIQGEGFFAVQTADGVRYTRNGQFQADAQNRLVTAQGDLVLGAGGGAVQVRPDGTVDPGQVGVVMLANPQKAGEGLVTGTPAGGAAGSVRPGALEGSGTDAAHAIVDMIASLRAFEASQRAITTIDETLGKAANQVGSLQ